MQPPMETRTPVPASKKLKSTVRVIFFMLRKGKKRLMLDLKVAGKTLFGDHVASTAGARVFSYAGPPPEEYEFSCSKKPAHRSLLYSLHIIGGKKGKSEHRARFEDALETMSLNDDVAASPAALPVPWTGGNGDCGVAAAAEGFIRRFYSQLQSQPSTDV